MAGEKPPSSSPGPYKGLPMMPPRVGAKAVLKPITAITNTAMPVMRMVLTRLTTTRLPSSPTSSIPTAMVIMKTKRPHRTTHRLLARTAAVTLPASRALAYLAVPLSGRLGSSSNHSLDRIQVTEQCRPPLLSEALEKLGLSQLPQRQRSRGQSPPLMRQLDPPRFDQPAIPRSEEHT